LRAAGGGARLLVDLEITEQGERKKETLTLFASRLQRLPKVGSIDADRLAYLRREAELGKALEAGMRVLAFGRCSRKRLGEKLRARGFGREAVEAAVADLAARGYLQESDGALREAERALSKLWGDRRILMELHAKGYPEEALDAVRQRLGAEDELARCRTLMRCRIGKVTEPSEIRHAAAFLSRYGYPNDMIRTVLGADEV
jgi:SOS response regulatory protein OraA/RecX